MLKCTECGWIGTDDELGGIADMLDPRIWCPMCGASDDHLVECEMAIDMGSPEGDRTVYAANILDKHNGE